MRQFFVCLSALSVITLCGCGGGQSGPAKYQVTGQVTFDQKPVAEGVIILYPTEKGLDADSGPIQNGKYSLSAKPGSKRVEIMASRKAEKQIIKGKDEIEQYIPPMYNQKSTLTADIKPNNSNKFDFDLKAK